MDLWGFSFWNIPHFHSKQTWTWQNSCQTLRSGNILHQKQPRMNSAGTHHQKRFCLYQVAKHENCCCLVSIYAHWFKAKSHRICCKVSWTSGGDQSIEFEKKTRNSWKQKSFQSFFWVLQKKRNHFFQPITHQPSPTILGWFLLSKNRGTDIPWPRWSNQKCPQDAKGRHPPRWSKSSNNLKEKWDSIKRFGIQHIYPTYISIPTRINVIHIHNTSGGLFNILHKLLWKRTAGSFLSHRFRWNQRSNQRESQRTVFRMKVASSTYTFSFYKDLHDVPLTSHKMKYSLGPYKWPPSAKWVGL